MSLRKLFEDELRRRALSFSIDPESGLHSVKVGDGNMLVNLENLERDYSRDGDAGRISRFVDSILASSAFSDSSFSENGLYWCLEPSDHVEPADFRVALTERVDRILVHLSEDKRLITWVTPIILGRLQLNDSTASAKAFSNLGEAFARATIETHNVDEVRLMMVGTDLPFKASLILAPNLRQIVESVLGWPVMAVAPDRDFLYLWGSRDSDFVQRVGGVVVREYTKASYPVSTEVYEITDSGIRAIGEFPTEPA